MTNSEVDATLQRIGDYSRSLLIDQFIRSRFAGRIPTIKPALQTIMPRGLTAAELYGRRALEAAFVAYQLKARHELSEAVQQHDALNSAAAKAEAAFGKFLSALHPTANTVDELELAIRTAENDVRVAASTAAGLEAQQREVIADARALMRAQKVIKRLKRNSSTKSWRLGKIHKHDPIPEQREFFTHLADMWIFLTGVKPGSNRDNAKTPFMRFVAAGWIDVFGEEAAVPEFHGASVSYLKQLDSARVKALDQDPPLWAQQGYIRI